MFSKQHLLKFCAALCALLFAFGVARLFWLRFEAGDLYPPYSSLRGDPLGVEVLHESLKELGNLDVSRNFKPLGQVSLDPRTTFFVCGIQFLSATTETEQWETLLTETSEKGGRLFFSFASTSQGRALKKDEDKSTDAEDVNPSEEKLQEEPKEKKDAGLWNLGLTLHRRDLDKTHPDRATLKTPEKAGTLARNLIFRSSLFFSLQDPAWETVYSFEDEPVVVQRPWGEGEVVMIADSYLLSNEALREQRATEFLAWVIRPASHVVFDEYHHGLARQPGISGLIRKYRLHGVVLSLAVVVALLIWQKAVVFAPRPEGADDVAEDEAAAAGGTDGWVNLMRRHIPPGDLLPVCFKAWKSSTAAERLSEEKVGQVRDLTTRQGESAQGEDPVAIYQSICELLKQGKSS